MGPPSLQGRSRGPGRRPQGGVAEVVQDIKIFPLGVASQELLSEWYVHSLGFLLSLVSSGLIEFSMCSLLEEEYDSLLITSSTQSVCGYKCGYLTELISLDELV